MNMKANRNMENTKLGGLVIAGILFLVFTLYMIGKNQNIFGASITITAIMDNVNGLVPGNNVRFKGMDVGTVRSIEMVDDSSIHVQMYIRNRMVPFVRKNALAAISTDGLMGNKIIQIIPQDGAAEIVDEGDIIYSLMPVSTDDMLQRMGTSSEFVEKITENLFEITSKLNDSESLWALLADSLLTGDIKAVVAELKLAATKATAMANAGNQLMEDLNMGEGLVNKLFTNEELAVDFASSLENIRESSIQAVHIVNQANVLFDSLEAGRGTIGLLLNDSSLRYTLANTMSNLEISTERFSENMEALRSNFLFRRHFRRIERARHNESKQ
jgi:phospholipid/cholesterol/gamma-HCH transport system substrate-binding protein